MVLLGVCSPLELFLLATENHLHPPELGTHVFTLPWGLCTYWPLLAVTSPSIPFLKIWLMPLISVTAAS